MCRKSNREDKYTHKCYDKVGIEIRKTEAFKGDRPNVQTDLAVHRCQQSKQQPKETLPASRRTDI
jgi:hypothetical protein